MALPANFADLNLQRVADRFRDRREEIHFRFARLEILPIRESLRCRSISWRNLNPLQAVCSAAVAAAQKESKMVDFVSRRDGTEVGTQ